MRGIRQQAISIAVVLVALIVSACSVNGQVPQSAPTGSRTFDGRSLSLFANQSPYRAYASMAGRFDDQSRLHTNLFLPLLHTREDLLFADVRGQYFNNGGAEGNLGLGYRHLFAADIIAGAYGFYDIKRSGNENTFHQATFGMELLSERWEVRVNGYLPEGGSAQATNATAVISGGNLVVQNNQERAYAGTDAEIGALLWRFPKFFDGELRGFAGVYHFDTDSVTAEAITGPRVRAEMRWFDLPCLALDSRVTLGLQYQDDDVRGSQSAATLAVRMPFGPDRGRHRRISHIERRMTDVVVRDVDVVTAVTATPDGQEAALHAVYDFEIGSVTVLDATTEDLPAAVAAATTDSVIINGSRGQIRLDAPIEVQDGQQLLGGGLAVKGEDTGIEARFGSAVTLIGDDDTEAVILTADNSIISGFNIFGGLHGISSDGDDLIDVLIINNSVTGADDSGFLFGSLDEDSVIAHNRATENGNHGFDIQENAGLFVQNNALANEGDGFNLFDNSGELSFNRSLRNEGDGFFADNNTGFFDENEAYENGASGFDFLNNTNSIADNLSADNELQGFVFANNTGTISGNSAFDNGSFGFDLADNNGTVEDNLAFDNGDIGFEFGDNFGVFQENSSSGNDGVGFGFVNNAGQFNFNEATDNTGDGFDFNENSIGGTFSDNVAEDNEGFGFDGTNLGTASDNTGSGNEDGGNTFP